MRYNELHSFAGTREMHDSDHRSISSEGGRDAGNASI